MSFVYAILMKGRDFLMVYNSKRGGWEMPGGSVEEGETPHEAVKREVSEETGLSFSPVDYREVRQGTVFVGHLTSSKGKEGEMRWRLFRSLPDRLAYSREEYEDCLEWARETLGRQHRYQKSN